MTHYRFAAFDFDTTTYTLLQRGKVVALRPKTAVLLAELLTHQRQILSKAVLFESVWNSSHVHDQSLFQAISEVRKLFMPLQPIKTHPNLGYQWVLPFDKPSPRAAGIKKRYTWALASMSFMLLIFVSVVLKPIIKEQTQPFSVAVFSIAPAMQAYNQGLQHLRSQELEQAGHFFDVAQQENPLFLEAALLKAEVLLNQQQYSPAYTQTKQVLAMAVAHDEQYIQVAARSLLSRISESDGELDSAFEWALEANVLARSQIVDDVEFACVAEDTQQRIADLLLQTPNTIPVDNVSDDQLAQSTDLPTHCQQLRDVETDDVELSQCINTDLTYQSIAAYPAIFNRQFS